LFGQDPGQNQERISEMAGNNSTSSQKITSEKQEVLLWVDPKDQQQMRTLGKALGVPWSDVRRMATNLQRKQRRNGNGQEAKDAPPSFVRKFFAMHKLGTQLSFRRNSHGRC